MDIRQLSYFVEVAEQQSFTKAAHTLNISQPALSKSISMLEEEFGLRLFVRKAGSISITEDGLAVLEIAQELLARFAAAQEQLLNIGTKKKHSVRLGLSPLLSSILGLHLMPEEIRYFSSVYCFDGHNSHLIGEVADEKLDMAVSFFYQDSRYENMNRVNRDPFHSGKLVAVVKAGSFPDGTFFEGLDRSWHLITSYEFFPLIQRLDVPFAAATFTENLDLIKHDLEKADVVALIPDLAVPFLGDKVQILDMKSPETYELAFVTRQGAKLSRPMREIQQQLIKKLEV